VVNNAESDENTSPEEDKPTTVSGLFVPSQWMFIDDKSNGLGDMIEASVFWSKKINARYIQKTIKAEQ